MPAGPTRGRSRFRRQSNKEGSLARLKPTTQYGNLPTLEIEDKGTLGQSNAILTWIGRSYDLHPKDYWEAAQHEALMAYCEELRERLTPTLRIKDPEEKQKARQALAEGALQDWGRRAQALITGPLVAGDTLNVADIKLYMVLRGFMKGVYDYIPTDVFKAFPKLIGLYEVVASDARVVSWITKTE